MIGDGWDGGDAVGPKTAEDPPTDRRRVVVVTGSRAEYGLLRPVMRAVAGHDKLELRVVAAGSHLVAPALTFRDVKRDFEVADTVPMQIAGRVGRHEDVEALARGVARFGRSFERLHPGWVVVLGDRVEAFAAATAASVGGYAVAHVHGGDRAEGIADEAMRHAITKLAHLHLAATEQSGQRIVRMGEDAWRVLVVGSPAVDELAGIAALDDGQFQESGAPTCVVLMHPVGRSDEAEEAGAAVVLEGVSGERVLALLPNFDAGRRGIVRALTQARVRCVEHVRREVFVGLLKRLAGQGPRGVLVGNSSAGLIEGAVLGVPVVDIGPRQAGRERCANVVHVVREDAEEVRRALSAARACPDAVAHPYGDGAAGRRAAEALARVDARETVVLRKRCAY